MEKRTWVEIDLTKIRKNIATVKRHTKRNFMACIKADCYGMGMHKIAKSIEGDVDSFGLATASEAMILREKGIMKPLLVMGAVLPGDVEHLILKNISFSLCNEEVLAAAVKAAAKTGIKAAVHIKVDTGLGRIGVKPANACTFIEKAAGARGIDIQGIFTHLATADWKDKSYAKQQLQEFYRVIEKSADITSIPLRHIANSAAIINMPETHENFDMVRIGLIMLGVYPEKYLYTKLPLEPAVTCYTRVNYLKEVEKGTPLSYGITAITGKRAKIATLGIGYADGLRRFLSNRHYLEFKGQKVKITGSICMDQTLVDVTRCKNIRLGDTVRVFGETFDIEEMASIGKTVPQEILCGFGSSRVEKIYK